MGYRQPILIEILSEVRFSPSAWEQSLIFKLVPSFAKIGLTEVELGQVGGLRFDQKEQNVQNIQNFTVPRIRCWSEDRTRLVQLFPDRVTINHVGLYPGWESFSQLFRDIMSHIEGLEQPPKALSLSLTTIDRMAVLAEDYQLGKYINCDGKRIPRWFEQSTEACDLTFGGGLIEIDQFNYQLQLSSRRDENKWEIVLHSVFHKVIPQSRAAIRLLEELHTESIQSFEELITDNTRELMGGKE